MRRAAQAGGGGGGDGGLDRHVLLRPQPAPPLGAEQQSEAFPHHASVREVPTPLTYYARYCNIGFRARHAAQASGGRGDGGLDRHVLRPQPPPPLGAEHPGGLPAPCQRP